jgi:8-oxo-dGTP diphosphatase
VPTAAGESFRETPGRVDVALAIPLRGGLVLVTRRQPGQHLAGCWEFPGGKIDRDEEPAQAARRELEEETGLRASTLEPLTLVVHDYVDQPLRLHVFLAREPAGRLRLAEAREWAWKRPEELGQLEMPVANRQMLRALRWRL